MRRRSEVLGRNMKPRAVIVAVSTALVAVSALATPALARPKTYVTHNCVEAKVKPRRIIFACADYGLFINHLKWRRWNHALRATGHGVYRYNDCKPDCARGTFHKRKARIVLRDRMWCPALRQLVFKHAKLRFRRPVNDERRTRFRLGCPF